MKARLIQIDGKIPNRALRCWGGYLKERGYEVFYSDGCPDPDLVKISCIFEWNAAKAHSIAKMFSCPVEIGGYGVSGAQLPFEVEHHMPDYEGMDYSVGFTSRGCIRNCPWCIVPEKEGPIHDHAPISEFHPPKFKKTILLDNNFQASPRWRENLRYIIDHGLKVNFNQGLDIRLVNEENAGMLADCKYYDWKFKERRLYFAFDTPEIEPEVRRGVQTLKDARIPPRRLMFYMLCGFGHNYHWDDHKGEVFHRFEVLNELGTDPFVMVWNNRRDIPELRHFARWVNKRIYKREPNFQNYDPSIGHGRKRESLTVET